MKLCVNPCQFNQPLAVDDILQLPYTLDSHQMSNPYQATVIRTQVNRSYIPDILDESILARDEIQKSKVIIFFLESQ